MITKLYRKFNRWKDWYPPAALSMDGWCQFNREFKETAPIRYWVHTEYRRLVVYPISRKYADIRGWIIYRTRHRLHVLPTGLKPGWVSADERMMCANFQLLVDSIECRRAASVFWWSDEYRNMTKWQKRKLDLPFRPKFRSRKLGMESLDWAAKLDDPSLPLREQDPRAASAAREMRELYIWWKDVRNVVDDNDTTGVPIDYTARDTEMLIRLIRIRNELDD